MVELLNEIPGIRAEILNAPYDLDFNTDDEIASLSEVALPPVGSIGGPLQTLYADMSVTGASYLRIGLPEVFDRNALKLIGVAGAAAGTTPGTLTNGLLEIATNNGDGDDQAIDSFELEADNVSYVSNTVLDAETVRGSLLVKASADDLDSVDIRVKVQRASFGPY